VLPTGVANTQVAVPTGFTWPTILIKLQHGITQLVSVIPD
jgi:hypothetical protein